LFIEGFRLSLGVVRVKSALRTSKSIGGKMKKRYVYTVEVGFTYLCTTRMKYAREIVEKLKKEGKSPTLLRYVDGEVSPTVME
jgi:hypothetical protein